MLRVSSTRIYPLRKRAWAFVALFLFIPSQACVFTWHKFLLDQFIRLLLFFFFISSGLHNLMAYTSFPFFHHLLCSWTCLPIGLCFFLWTLIAHLLYLSTHWAFTSFLGPSWSICFTFTSPCAHGSGGCHFLPCWPIGLLPLSLGSHGLFALLLPFTALVGLLACWAFTSFFGLL